MFYAQDTGNPRFDMARNLAGRRRDIAMPANIDLTWNAPFRGLGSGPDGTDLLPQPYGLANIYNRRTPYSIQYLLNVQRELTGDTALEIGLFGSVFLFAMLPLLYEAPNKAAHPGSEDSDHPRSSIQRRTISRREPARCPIVWPVCHGRRQS